MKISISHQTPGSNTKEEYEKLKWIVLNNRVKTSFEDLAAAFGRLNSAKNDNAINPRKYVEEMNEVAAKFYKPRHDY